METIQQKYQRLKDELKAETQENLIIAKKVCLKQFEKENNL
ncbi:hypothetical protein [Flavobacterium sp.]|nr:hypothetical protein [Flavobacterium sp.]